MQELLRHLVRQALACGLFGTLQQAAPQPVDIEPAHLLVVPGRHHDTDNTIAPRVLNRCTLHTVYQRTESCFRLHWQ